MSPMAHTDPPLTSEGTLSRIDSLRLAREINRSFVAAVLLEDALQGCIDAIASLPGLTGVSLTITEADDLAGLQNPGVAACGFEAHVSAGMEGATVSPPPSDLPGDEDAISVPIFVAGENVGSLAAVGSALCRESAEALLEEAADELGRCLSGFRERQQAVAPHTAGQPWEQSERVAAIQIDADRRVTQWNAGARRLFGWSAPDVLNGELPVLADHDSSEQLRRLIEEAFHGCASQAVPLTAGRWDGRCFPATVDVLPAADRNGPPREVLLLFTDRTREVTLQRWTDALQETAAFLIQGDSLDVAAENLLRAIGTAAGWTRGEFWRMDDVNQVWTLSGCWNTANAAADASWAGPLNEVTQNQSPKFDQGMPGVVREQRTVTHFGDLSSQRQWPRAVVAARCGLHDALGVPVLLDGEVAAVLLFFGFEIPPPDATETQSLEAIAAQLAGFLERLRLQRSLTEAEQNAGQAQKMEAVGLLAGGIAHDFNNLLTIILGHSEITLESLEADSPLSPLVSEIEKAGERAAALTRQLLAFSRKQSLEPVNFNVNKQVRDVEGMLRRLLDKRIELETRLTDPLHLVRFDLGQFDQVLMNLVVNARDAIAESGRITIETKNVALSAAATRDMPDGKPGDYVVLTVADTGCGMDEATLQRVFEPFFTTKQKGKGTGMGLSTVYGVVQQSGGFLSIDSRVNEGTLIHVFLPRAHDVPETMLVDSQLTEDLSGTETVLLVEDEDVLRSLTTRMLEARGYTVLQASDGKTALRLMKRHRRRVDLLLSDVMMPEMTGPELVSRLEASGIELPVLFMSGYIDVASVDRSITETGCPLLRKPFNSHGLASAVRSCLDTARRADDGN